MRASRRIVAALLALIVIATTAAVVVALNRRSTNAATGASYHVVYRVTNRSVVNTEQLWVRRPFEGRDEVFAGSSADGKPLSTVIMRLGRQFVHASTGAPTVLEVAPAPTTLDIRVRSVAAEAIRSGLLEYRGDLRVAQLSCRVYRSRRKLGVAPLNERPRASDHVDTCVDDRGVVLDERVVTQGRTTERRTALRVDRANGAFTTKARHVPLALGGGRVVTVTNDSRPPGTSFWNLTRVPVGFVHMGRFAVVPPQPHISELKTASPLTEMDDVFVNGSDVITVEQGQSGRALEPLVGGRDVDLGPLGHGRLRLSALASSVTVRRSASSFVRVSGTVAPDELIAVARSLDRQSGTKLVVTKDLATDGAS